MRTFICIFAMTLLYGYAEHLVIPSVFMATAVAAIIALFQDVKELLGKD